MKKNILLTIMFITLFFIGSNDVLAELKCEVGDEGCTIEAISEEINKTYSKSRIACLYEVKLDKEKKYYNYIFYSESKDKIYGGTTLGMGGYKELLSDNNAWILGNAYHNLYNNNQCPIYSYIDNKGLGKELCFDDNKECQNNGKEINLGTDFNLTTNSKLVDDNSSILKYNTLSYKNSCDKTNLPEGYNNVCRYQGEDGYVLLLYNDTTNKLIYNISENGLRASLNPGDKQHKYTKYLNYSVYENKISSTINSCPSNIYLNKSETTTDDTYTFTYDNYTWELNASDEFTKYRLSSCRNNSTEIVDSIYYNCSSLLDGELLDIIKDIMNVIRIVVPLLLIGLITYDFAMIVLSGADDKVSKIKKRAIQRVVIAIAIFFVPTFINLVFNLVNDVWDRDTNFSTCGITESE